MMKVFGDTRCLQAPLAVGLLALAITVAALIQPAAAAGGAFVVSTNADSGPGSLRDAITRANADAGAAIGSPHQITFDLPAGSTTINVLTALPAVTRPTVIDGLSQPGSTCGSAGTPRNLIVHVRGRGNALAMTGLRFTGGGSTLQGLAVSYFRSGNVISTGATGGDLIRCNHIGANPAGNIDTIASNGVALSGNPVVTVSLDISSPTTRIGGVARTAGVCDGDCNVVLGESVNNNQIGVMLRFGSLGSVNFNGYANSATSIATGGTMQGNFIGITQSGQNVPPTLKTSRNIFVISTDAAAAAPPATPQPIPSSGAYLIGGLDGSGTRDPLAGNVISAAKFRDGIDSDTSSGSASGVRIYGNLVGTGPDGVASVDSAGVMYGNARDGIQLEGEQAADIQGNIISGNGSNGINAGSISNNTLIRNNIIGLTASSAADGNGWYSTAFTPGNPNFGMGGVTVNNNAGNGNGISVGAFGASVPNRDVENLAIDGNVIGANARAGIIAVGGSGNTAIRNNHVGVTPAGVSFPNQAGGVVLFTDNNNLDSNVIAINGGPGVSVVRNTNAAIGTTIGGYVPVPATATNNTITRNSIYGNAGVGIDLNSVVSTWGASGNTILFPYAWTQGVTANDGVLSPAPPTNAGTFGNRDVDYPVFDAAVVSESAGTITTSGHVGLPGGAPLFAGATVEVFRGDNTPADQNGEIHLGDGRSVAHPEGRTFLGTCAVSAAGTFTDCVITLPTSAAASTWTVADLVAGTTTLGSATSEFGAQTKPVEVNLLLASVRIDKEVCTLGTVASACDATAAVGAGGWAESQTFSYLNTPVWRLTITNTGQLPLSNIVVKDPLALDCEGIKGSLAVGATFKFVCVGDALTGPVDPNTATVVATGRDGDVKDDDTASALLEEPAPAISIVKSVNGDDANTAPGVLVTPGGALTFTYVVKNTGNVPLKRVTVTDDQGVAVDCGDGTNMVALVAAGASVTCTGSGDAPEGQYMNIGTVRGTPVTGTPVTGDPEAKDPAYYFGAEPAIMIVKSLSGKDANTAPGVSVLPGSMMDFTYEVTNTGNVDLTDVGVVDDKGVVVTCPATVLAVGDPVMTCTGTATAPMSGTYTNIGTATGTGPDTTDRDGKLVKGEIVTDNDRATASVSVPPSPVPPLLASTGTSILFPALAGSGLLAAAGLALLFSSRRRRQIE